jgi:hypothetical protein
MAARRILVVTQLAKVFYASLPAVFGELGSAGFPSILAVVFS